MSDIAIDDLPDSQPALEPYRPPKPLAELYPDEIRFYAGRFIWSSNRSGFYTRTAREGRGGMLQTPGCRVDASLPGSSRNLSRNT